MKQIILILSVFLCSCSIALAHKNDSTLQQYAGRYKFPEGSVISEVSLSVENGTLILTASVGASNLEKKADDEFAITSYSGVAVFKRNEAKKVVGIHIEAMGYVLDGTREESVQRQQVKDETIPELIPLIPIIRN